MFSCTPSVNDKVDALITMSEHLVFNALSVLFLVEKVILNDRSAIEIVPLTTHPRYKE